MKLSMLESTWMLEKWMLEKKIWMLRTSVHLPSAAVRRCHSWAAILAVTRCPTLIWNELQIGKWSMRMGQFKNITDKNKTVFKIQIPIHRKMWSGINFWSRQHNTYKLQEVSQIWNAHYQQNTLWTNMQFWNFNLQFRGFPRWPWNLLTRRQDLVFGLWPQSRLPWASLKLLQCVAGTHPNQSRHLCYNIERSWCIHTMCDSWCVWGALATRGRANSSATSYVGS